MAETNICPDCGAAIPAGGAAEPCVGCLLLLAGAADGSAETMPAAPHPSPDAPPGAAPESFGDYDLLEEIGRGGMGVVWKARQLSLNRLVALKLIKPGMDSGQVLARFDAERQALALMDHPNIARVIDAGTTPDGWPFFVMELVEGVPIRRFCDERRLTIRERLELFIQVCQAIQHAHQKGVIHRDIKPGNVLVTVQDGKAVPKVIDFGIAKAIGPRLTPETVATEIGALLGTLEYMSPEQASLNSLDIDTRSDIYSLGILLYELLTGTTPLDRKTLKQSAFDELLRRIREEEPPKPSTRLCERRATLADTTAQRKADPARLPRLLQGDVDWIVMKALEKDRNRRYATANALAQDLQRHLRQEPVLARPISTVERTWRWCRRKPLVASLVVAVFVSLLTVAIGSVIAVVQVTQANRREKHQRQVAEASEKQAVAALAFLQEMFRSIDPEEGAGAMITVKQLLDAKEAQLVNRFEGQPAALFVLHKTIGIAYGNLRDKAPARRHLEAALRLKRSFIPTNDLETAELYEELGFASSDSQSTSNLALAAAIRQQLQGTNSAGFIRAKSYEAGSVFIRDDNRRIGELMMAQILALPGESPEQAHQRIEGNLRRAGDLWAAGRGGAARAMIRADADRFLGNRLMASQTPGFLVELADREWELGHTNTTEPLMLEAMSIARSHLAPMSAERFRVCSRFSDWLRQRSRHADAEPLLREAWIIRTNKYERGKEETVATGLRLADSLLHLGRTNESDDVLAGLPRPGSNTVDVAEVAMAYDCDWALGRMLETGWFGTNGFLLSRSPILIRATRRDKGAAIRELLRHGADVEGADKDGNTPLIWAATINATNALVALLDGGARANAARADDGWVALLSAARQGHLEIAKTLLDHGADPRQALTGERVKGSTPLHLAAQYDQADFVRLLLSRGVSADDRGTRTSTPLHEAALHGAVRAMRVLLESGASVNATNSRGHTPLHYATATNRTDGVELLLQQGATLNAPDHKNQTPLHHSVLSQTDAVLESLLRAGALPNLPDNEGLTPLHHAASLNATNAIRQLLAARADATVKTSVGKTPLELAVQHGHSAAAALLQTNATTNTHQP